MLLFIYTVSSSSFPSLFLYNHKRLKDNVLYFLYISPPTLHPTPVGRVVSSFIIPCPRPPAALTSTPLPRSWRWWGIRPNLLHFKLLGPPPHPPLCHDIYIYIYTIYTYPIRPAFFPAGAEKRLYARYLYLIFIILFQG